MDNDQMVDIEIVVTVQEPGWMRRPRGEERVSLTTLLRNTSVIPFSLVADGLAEKAIDSYIQAKMDEEEEVEEKNGS